MIYEITYGAEMSKDFTAQVIYQPSNHAISNAKQNAQRYQVGDILNVWPIETHASFDADSGDWLLNDEINSKFLFIHVTGVPNSRNPQKLLEGEFVANGSPILIDVQENPFIRRRLRKFKIKPSLIPKASRDKLLANKQITVPFVAFKNVVVKKTVSVTLDSDQDSHDLVVDGDM